MARPRTVRRPGDPNTRRRRRIFAIVAAAACLQALLVVAAVVINPQSAATDNPANTPEPSSRADQPDGRGHEKEEHQDLPDEMLYTYDIEDERIVSALSENVFLGRVEARAGSERAKSTIPDDPGRPQRQYAVSVLGSAKATGPAPLSRGERARVNQEIGEHPETGRPLPIQAAYCGTHRPDSFLVPGQTYLFATFYETGRDLHTLTAQPTGAVRVGSEEEGKALLAAWERSGGAQVDKATGQVEGARPCE